MPSGRGHVGGSAHHLIQPAIICRYIHPYCPYVKRIPPTIPDCYGQYAPKYLKYLRNHQPHGCRIGPNALPTHNINEFEYPTHMEVQNLPRNEPCGARVGGMSPYDWPRRPDRVCVGGGRRDGRIAASAAFAEQEIAHALRDGAVDSVRTYATVTSGNEGLHLLDITNPTDIGELHLASTQGINVYSANNNFNPESDQQQACDIPAIVRQYDADGICKIEQGEWLVAIADYTADPLKLTTPQLAAHRG